MNLSEIVANVNAELNPATNINALIKRWANKAQGRFVSTAAKNHGHKFKWLQKTNLTLSLESGVEEYGLLPFLDMGKIIYFTERTSKKKIYLVTLEELRESLPDPTMQSGIPDFAYFAGYAPVQKQPSSASQLTFVSTLGDNAVVKIEGLNSAGTAMLGEELTLTGAVPVASQNTYSKVINLGFNGFLTGTVTITSNAGAVTNAVISPRMRQPKFPVVGFNPIPGAIGTLYYDGNFDLPPLVNDNDFSLIPERYHDAIEEYCLMRGYRHKKDLQSATLSAGAFVEVVEQAVMDDKDPERQLEMESDYGGASCLGPGTLPGLFPRGY